MIDRIKEKIARFIIKKELKGRKRERRSFGDFFNKSFNYFVIMPENENDFKHSMAVLEFLKQYKKISTIFTFDFRVNMIPIRYRDHLIDHGIGDLNKLNLPSRRLVERIKENKYDVVIDLNRCENIFYSYAASLAFAPVRVGFNKTGADRYYNILISDSGSDAEISYKNFLNCLRMF
jgi:ADP-heptose:LPS heptosyltransferase